MSLRSLLAFSVLGLVPNLVVAQLPVVTCAPPADATRQDFIIDAASGDATGETHYQLADRIRIVVVNKNPFLFDYKLTVQDVVVAEPGLARFRNLFPFATALLGGSNAGAPAGTPTAPAAPLAADAGPSPCAQAITSQRPLADRIATENAALVRDGAAAAQEHQAFAQAFTQSLATVEQLEKRLTTSGRRCADLVADLATLMSTIDGLAADPRLPALKRRVRDLLERSDAQAVRIDDYRQFVSPHCPPAVVEAHIEGWRNQVQLTRSVAKAIDAQLKEIDAALANLGKQKDELKRIASSPKAFHEVVLRGPFEKPTNVEVKLEQKAVGNDAAKFTEVGRWTLNFGGGPRFALTAGIAFSQLEDRAFQRVKGFARQRDGELVRDANGVEKFTTVVGLKRDSENRATPLVMLHGRLWQPKDPSWFGGVHFAFGLSAKVETSDTDVEYLAGFSFSLADDLFLTLGGYYGGVQELQGDLFVGSEIPATLTEDLPVRKDKRWAPAISLSYRIQ